MSDFDHEHVRLDKCPRCDGVHDDVCLRALTNASDDYTHWTMCPVLDEPVVVRVERRQDPQ